MLQFLTLFLILFSMEFVHKDYKEGQTIAALATAPGEGGIAIIRISGHLALSVAEKMFSGKVRTYQSHTAHLGSILDTKGQSVDMALCLVMLGPKSFTGEDTVEFHCHGGALVARKVLEIALESGARAATAGEFTFKAFMNGKMDLSQAEAVQELIASKNDLAMRSALSQLEGSLTIKIQSFQKDLFDIAAILEAWVDFPEEGLEFASMDEVKSELMLVNERIVNLKNSFHDGKILHDGLSLCLVGLPNVGKSSLMNLLLDKDRAIVTPIAGTTRDLLEDYLKINGLNVRLIDTAGIRDTDEVIEIEGIKRSKGAMKEADLVLFVLDAQRGFEDKDEALFHELPKEKTIVIWNKCDIASQKMPRLDIPYVIQMSAKEKIGLNALKQSIDQIIWDKGPPSKEEVIITNVRHKEALDRASSHILSVIEGLDAGVSPEFVTFDMREALIELGSIIGTNISESILTSVFSKFCIGK